MNDWLKRLTPSRRAFVIASTASALFVRAAGADLAIPAPREDCPHHDQFAAAWVLLQARKWTELSTLTAGLPPQSACILLDELGTQAPLATSLAGLEHTPMGNTIIGACEVNWGWTLRGSGVGSTVTEEGEQGFETHLKSAKIALDAAIGANADDGVAHAMRFRVNKGLGDLMALYQDLPAFLAAARRPVSGFAQYADAISGKWLGSNNDCLTFARRYFMIDPPASCGLLPDAHFITMSAELMSARLGYTPQLMFNYFTQAAVHNEIVSANENFRAVPADLDRYANLYANAAFAFAFLCNGEKELARPHVLAMGDYIGGPWSDLPDPRVLLEHARTYLGINAL